MITKSVSMVSGKMTMTKKRGNNNQQHRFLKAAIFTGSVVATLAGTRMIGAEEMAAAVAGPQVTDAVTVIVPAAGQSKIELPPTNRGTELQLEAIPQVVEPQINPVARTRSSR